MIRSRRTGEVGATGGAFVARTRGPGVPEVVVGRTRIKQRPHDYPDRRCERCQAKRARDADLSDPLCSPCRVDAPMCPVCRGRGTLGRDAHQECYRCKGSGVRPIPKLNRRTP